jgi:CRP-like cAMP-binding protein
MTSDVKTTRSEAQLGGSALCSASKGRALCQASTVLAAHATPLRTRRGQAVALMFEGGETAFIVRAGVLTLQVTMPGTTRQVVAMLFQGDVLRSSFAPPYAEGALVSAGTGEVWRMRWTACAELAAGDPAIALYFDDALANQMARQAIHAAALGRFDCEQRVATFLIELALRTGVSTSGGGIVFDMPFQPHGHCRLSRPEPRYAVAHHVAVEDVGPDQPFRAEPRRGLRSSCACGALAGRSIPDRDPR